MGANVVVRGGPDLQRVPSGTVLELGDTAAVRLTFACDTCSCGVRRMMNSAGGGGAVVALPEGKAAMERVVADIDAVGGLGGVLGAFDRYSSLLRGDLLTAR